MKYYERWQENSILEAVKTRRVPLLSGARQCGKTTLAKQIGANHAIYRTLDDLTVRELAVMDPQGFVERDDKMLIIDEIQRVPDLLSAIKLAVDENTTPGQYLLTGSANIQALPSTQESLAGRMRKIRLRTLMQGELCGIKPNFLHHAFKQLFASPYFYDRKNMLEMAFRGGFPEAIKLDEKERRQWHKDYMSALIERDLRDIANINRVDAMEKLVTILAAWSGKFMDISAIGSSLSIKRPTIESYIRALQALYVTETVLPWTRTDYERVGKQSKLYMTDSG